MCSFSTWFSLTNAQFISTFKKTMKKNRAISRENSKICWVSPSKPSSEYIQSEFVLLVFKYHTKEKYTKFTFTKVNLPSALFIYV